MARLEDFPSDAVEQWRADIMNIAGVERASVVIQDGQQTAKDYDKFPDHPGNYEYAEMYRSLGAYAKIDVVAPWSAKPAIIDYALQHIPQIDATRSGGKQEPFVPIVDSDVWHTLVEAVDGQSIMDYLLTSHHVEGPAERTHQEWLATKIRDLEDPLNPYRGYGPTRIKVGDLETIERQALGISPDADPRLDVYHPFHKPFIDLDQSVKNRNVVPMAAACLAIGDFLVDDAVDGEQLRQAVLDLAYHVDPNAQKMLNKVAHVVWAAGDIASGGRPWSAGAEPNYHLYDRLTPDIQDLDTQANQTQVTYLQEMFEPLSGAELAMYNTLTREGGPYEQWWSRELSVLSAAGEVTIGTIGKRHTVARRTDSQDTVSSFKEAINISYMSNTGNNYSTERFARDMDNFIEAALRRGHIKYDAKTTEWQLTDNGRLRLNELVRVFHASICLASGRLIRDGMANYAALKERYCYTAN